ncbi:unnamed protein product, partial [Heligmosomoides polygyrus]
MTGIRLWTRTPWLGGTRSSTASPDSSEPCQDTSLALRNADASKRVFAAAAYLVCRPLRDKPF